MQALRPAGLPAELEDLRQRVVMMGDTLLPAARAADELIDAVAAIEALKSTLDAFELQVVAELEATGAVKPFGWASTKDFCTAVIGGHRAPDRRWSGLPKTWRRHGSPRWPRRCATAGFDDQGDRDHPRSQRSAVHS